jgi:hypothetical protein
MDLSLFSFWINGLYNSRFQLILNAILSPRNETQPQPGQDQIDRHEWDCESHPGGKSKTGTVSKPEK